MELYLPDMVSVTTNVASMFGAFQLITIAAFYIFKLEFVKPRSK